MDPAPRGRRSWRLLLLACAVVLALGSCSRAGGQPPGDDDGGSGEPEVGLGWSLFAAAEDQWQIRSALERTGVPWYHEFSLVSQLRPGARAPLYEGELPVNTLVAPARPTSVASGGQFGWRTAPDLGVTELHNGADIGAKESTAVVAAMDGVVRAVFWDVWGGNRVEVAHAAGDVVTTYNHLEKVFVEQGERLKASQQLGTVGKTGSRVTGPHLHFETWVDGKQVIRAPHERDRAPGNIPQGGPGDNATIDPGQSSCPHRDSDPGLCHAPDEMPKPSDRCPGAGGGPGSPDCAPVDLLQCRDLLYGRYDCEPLGPGPEDCPPTGDGRQDCPGLLWPDLTDPGVCQDLGEGRINCFPFELFPGQEDCPSAAGGRAGCPDPANPSLDQCLDRGAGVFDCYPFGPLAGPEDCLPATPGPSYCPPQEPDPCPSAAGGATACPSPSADPSSSPPVPPTPGPPAPTTPSTDVPVPGPSSEILTPVLPGPVLPVVPGAPESSGVPPPF